MRNEKEKMDKKEIESRLNKDDHARQLKKINQRWKAMLNENGLKQIKIIKASIERKVPYEDPTFRSNGYVTEGARCLFTFTDNDSDNYDYVIEIYIDPYSKNILVNGNNGGGKFLTLEEACLKAKELYEEYKITMDEHRLEKKKKDDKIVSKNKHLEKIYILRDHTKKYPYTINELDQLHKKLKEFDGLHMASIEITEYGYLDNKKLDMSIFEYVDYEKFFEKKCKKLREWNENTKELLWKMFINDVKNDVKKDVKKIRKKEISR